MHGRFLHSIGLHRVYPVGTWLHLGTGARMSLSQIILFIIAVVMFGYLGYAMFKPEKF